MRAILDFKYRDSDGVIHFVDTKGYDPALSYLKRQLVQAIYKIKVDVI